MIRTLLIVPGFRARQQSTETPPGSGLELYFKAVVLLIGKLVRYHRIDVIAGKLFQMQHSQAYGPGDDKSRVGTDQPIQEYSCTSTFASTRPIGPLLGCVHHTHWP